MYIYRIFYISTHTGYFSRVFQNKKKKVSLRTLFFFLRGEQESGWPWKPRTWQLLGGMTATASWEEEQEEEEQEQEEAVGRHTGSSSGSECVDFKALSSPSLTRWTSAKSSRKN